MNGGRGVAVIAMSGGVDSSAAALFVHHRGAAGDQDVEYSGRLAAFAGGVDGAQLKRGAVLRAWRGEVKR